MSFRSSAMLQTVRAWLRLLGLVLVMLALAAIKPPKSSLLPAQPHTVETGNEQICVHTLLENEVEESKILRSLQLVRELGAASIVQFFPWAYVEAKPGQYNWDGVERIVQHARAQGLRIIARLGLVPPWANEGEATLNTLPDSAFGAFAAYAGAFAGRYAAVVEHIIIWNEPNLSFEWGYAPVDVSRYARLLEASHAAIKAANPQAQVLAGALAPTLEPAASASGMNERDFLLALYALGAAAHFDALAVHSYGFLVPPEAAPGWDRLNFRRAELLRDIMSAQGDEDKTVFITEFGWNDHSRWRGAVRPSQRSAYTIRAFQYAAQHWDWVESLCLWALRFPADTLNSPDGYTLYNAAFTPKAIALELQAYARGWERAERHWLPPPRASA